MNFEQLNQKPEKNKEKSPIQMGIESALRLTDQDSLEAGDAMAWSGDNIFYQIKEINGDKAVVWVPGDNSSEKTVNKKELYDPYLAKRMTKLIQRSKEN